ncbi:cation diffusion facilitator family transporter [Acidisphaera sp. L21]|uniref:cation diffusion facilitator family transporter n=1 Tax=Acidisphaera sp. L21 TaxID=1641851 RepID=UPI0020B14938|nr:cation transporter dimerization domain-containing protein [Acidisphaera sp. L21]
MWTIGAVLVGFALVPLTRWPWMNPVVAALVTANILWAGYGMLRESVGGLMDEVSYPKAVAGLRQVISANPEGAIEAHDVRTRRFSNVTFAAFHLVVPGRIAVQDAYTICDRIETALRAEEGEAVINIHKPSSPSCSSPWPISINSLQIAKPPATTRQARYKVPTLDARPG